MKNTPLHIVLLLACLFFRTTASNFSQRDFSSFHTSSTSAISKGKIVLAFECRNMNEDADLAEDDADDSYSCNAACYLPALFVALPFPSDKPASATKQFPHLKQALKQLLLTFILRI